MPVSYWGLAEGAPEPIGRSRPGLRSYVMRGARLGLANMGVICFRWALADDVGDVRRAGNVCGISLPAKGGSAA